MASTTDMDRGAAKLHMARGPRPSNHVPNERTGFHPFARFERMRFASALRSYSVNIVRPFVRSVSGGVASPARSIVLLPGRSLREVLANGGGLLRVQHPRRVLVLGGAGEVRAKERANELATNVQLGRDLLRTNVLDCGHDGLPSFARALRAFACRQSVASIGRMCAYALFGFCKRSIERTFVIGRALSVRATGRALSDVTTPPFHPHAGGIARWIFAR